MHLDGAVRYFQSFCDLLVRQSSAHQKHHFALTSRQHSELQTARRVALDKLAAQDAEGVVAVGGAMEKSRIMVYQAVSINETPAKLIGHNTPDKQTAIGCEPDRVRQSYLLKLPSRFGRPPF